jgi:L-lactate dehydrogenase complex protein LldE
MKVGLFIPCLVDQFFPETAIAVCKIFKKLKIDIDYPIEQTCCGQPAYNTGYRKEAQKIAKRFIDVFNKYEYIVAPSGSCVSMVKILYPTLNFDNTYSTLCAELTSKIFEFSEFLVDKLNIVDLDSTFKGKATYHSSCHLTRELGVKEPPKILIKNVKGIEFIESENSEECCGFGGTFAVKFKEISTSMAEDKVEALLKTGAQYVIGGDNSCLMNIDGIIKLRNLPIKTIHLAEVLAYGL